jgi:RNA polymerase sigma factor (sigma-70 family)
VADHEAAGRDGDDVASLVTAAQGGDDRAWRVLVARYVDLVWSVARSHDLGHCDAADVTQTTWMRLHEHLPVLQEPDRVAQWLMTTARREALRVRRERQRRAAETGPAVAHAAAADEDLTHVGEERDRLLWQAFRQLSPSCQTLLRALSSEEPPSYADLSATLGMPVGSIGPTRARCLDRLRANLMTLTAPRPGRAGAGSPEAT